MPFEVFRFSVLRPPESKPTSRMVTLPRAERVEERLGSETMASIARTNGRNLGLLDADMRTRLAAGLALIDDATILERLAADVRRIEEIEDGVLTVAFGDDDRDDAEPVSHPAIRPVGVSDLYLVEQDLLRYEAGEIAHVENVMATETRERRHTVTTEDEETFLDEVESETSSEQDLHTAERFELSTAAKEASQTNMSLNASLDVKAKYGPTIEVASGLRFSLENSRSRSTETASTFAREVTERAVSRTSEKVKQSRTTRSLRRVEHFNKHGFENTAQGASHISGIYQYLDKVYRMRLMNHGPRFFYEFLVPSPGAFLRELGSAAALDLPPEPPKPTVRAESITPSNYKTLMKSNGISSVTPPPETRMAVAVTMNDSDSGSDGAQSFRKEDKLTIPPDYVVNEFVVSVITFKKHTTDPTIEVVVGEASFTSPGGSRPDGGLSRDAPLTPQIVRGVGGYANEVGWMVHVRHDSTVQIKIEAVCDPSPEKMEEWRLSVYDKIMQKYQEDLAEWRSEVGAIEAQESFETEMSLERADVYRQIERDELKRLCLQLIGQTADAADPMHEGGTTLVMEKGESPLDEGQGDQLIDLGRLRPFSQEVLFAEQAFEWESMSFQTYPYYWNDPADWREMMLLQHDDPEHEAFLKAGAARVLVPIRPNFERRVHNFLSLGRPALSYTGEVNISSPEWVPLLAEIAEAEEARRRAATGEGESAPPPFPREEGRWIAKVPTNLVKLRDDSSLPVFDGDA